MRYGQEIAQSNIYFYGIRLNDGDLAMPTTFLVNRYQGGSFTTTTRTASGGLVIGWTTGNYGDIMQNNNFSYQNIHTGVNQAWPTTNRYVILRAQDHGQPSPLSGLFWFENV